MTLTARTYASPDTLPFSPGSVFFAIFSLSSNLFSLEKAVAYGVTLPTNTHFHTNGYLED